MKYPKCPKCGANMTVEVDPETEPKYYECRNPDCWYTWR